MLLLLWLLLLLLLVLTVLKKEYSPSGKEERPLLVSIERFPGVPVPAKEPQRIHADPRTLGQVPGPPPLSRRAPVRFPERARPLPAAGRRATPGPPIKAAWRAALARVPEPSRTERQRRAG